MTWRSTFGTFCTLAISVVLFGAVTAQATACTVAQQIDGFFDSVPTDVVEFVVLEVTLVDVKPTGQPLYWGVARVDRVIKGQVDSNVVTLFFDQRDYCQMFLSDRTHGIIVATIRNAATNELVAMTNLVGGSGEYRRPITPGPCAGRGEALFDLQFLCDEPYYGPRANR
jgi:hypothetical protein